MIICDLICISGIAIEMIKNEYFIIAGRFICGFGAGMNTLLVPVYIFEISPPKISG